MHCITATISVLVLTANSLKVEKPEENSQMKEIKINARKVVICVLYFNGLLILKCRSMLITVRAIIDASWQQSSKNNQNWQCSSFINLWEVTYKRIGMHRKATKRSATARHAMKYLFGWCRRLSSQVATRTNVLPKPIAIIKKTNMTAWAYHTGVFSNWWDSWFGVVDATTDVIVVKFPVFNMFLKNWQKWESEY